MADLIIPDDCGLVTSTWTLSGKANPMTCTLGVHNLADVDPALIVANVYSGWTDTGAFCSPTRMGVGWVFEGCTMIYNVGGGVLEGYAAGDPVVGTATSIIQMIVSSTLLLQKRTSRVGRHFRGRMYLPNMWISQ